MRVIGTLAQSGDTEAPTQPQNLQATAINRQRVDLTWTASTDNVGVTGYQVFRDGSPLNTTSGTTYSDTTATASTTYDYTVVAFDAAGNNSVASDDAQATTPANASPAWQTIPSQTLIVGDSFTLNLNNFCSDADADTIQYSIASGGVPTGITLGGAVISGTPTLSGETPSVTIDAFDGFVHIQTSFSFATFGADVTAPPIPAGLAASPGSTSIDVSWGASADVAGSANEFVSGTQDYRVFRSTDGTNFSLRTTVTSPSYSDTGLSASTTYYYKVTARDAELNESAQSSAASATTSTALSITTIALTSAAVSGTHPFYEAQAFAEGAVPNGQSIVSDTSGVTLRAVPRARWPDNSLRHAVLVGSATFTQNVAKSIALKTGAAAAGTNLTATSLVAANPTASQQCGSIGTVSLTSLLASPFRTLISTPEMVECHYRSAVGSDAHLVAWFHARLWADGRVRVRAFVENGYLSGAPTTRTYVWTVVVGGVTVHNTSRTHEKFARMDAVGWIGVDPQITPSHNVSYLDTSMATPHYGWAASTTALNALQQSYTQMSVGPLRTNTSGTAYHPSIGHHPLWDVAYFTTGDVRGYRALDAAARSANIYPLVRRSSVSNRHPRISDFPTTTYTGGGTENLSNDATLWDVSHAPHEGGGAYLVTGDYYHYETALFAAQAWYFCRNSSGGSGVNRNLRGFQPRGLAWGLHTIGFVCAFAPTENADAADLGIITDLKAWLGNVYTNFGLYIDVVGQTKLGFTFAYSTGDWNGAGSIPPWMYNWWNGTNGRLRDLKPLADMTAINRMAQFMYRITIGMLGSGTASEYHFSRAANYGVIVDPTSPPIPDFAPSETAFHDSWGSVWTSTHSTTNNETTNTLQGDSASNPTEAPAGYWGYLRTGLVQAVDHGCPSALTGYRRMTGASNYSTILNSGFDNIPIMGWIPRTRTTALALAAAQLGAGQSIKLGTIPSSVLNIDGAGFSVLQYGSSGVYDPFRRQLRFIGKRSSDQAPYRFLIYDEATDVWSINTAVWAGGQANQNGHGYDHNAMDPLTGYHYHRPYNDTVVQVWNGSSWSSLPSMGTSEIAGALTWHPRIGNNGALIYSDQRRIRKYVGGTWTEIANFGSVASAYHTVSEYNANSDVFLFGAGNASDDFRRMTSGEVISSVAAAPLNFGSSELHGLFIADPIGRGFIGWKKETTSWRHYSPDTNAWTTLTQSVGSGATPQNGTPPLSNAANGRHAICFSIDAYGVMMFVQYTGGSGADTWLYRHT